MGTGGGRVADKGPLTPGGREGDGKKCAVESFQEPLHESFNESFYESFNQSLIPPNLLITREGGLKVSQSLITELIRMHSVQGPPP